jgi:acyl-CoA synthetase (AMP-forming)/AMP-acid ligase II
MTATSVLYELTKTRPKHVAFIKENETWTYERLAAEVDRLARGLVRRGLRKGDRVALHMANLPELIIAYHACFWAGLIAAPLNIRLKTAELRPLLERLRPSLYIGQATLYEKVASIDSSITYGLDPGPVNRIVRKALVRLVDDNDVPVAVGELGELLVRGPHVSIGYWAGPGLIQDAPVDGWFHTGDLMRQDEKGNLWFISRKKHLIIRGGSNISPIEVERVLLTHPAVRDAAVLGVPDPELGQRVAGFVQLRAGAQSTDPDEILLHVSGQLADYKVPERLQIVQEIPRNATGKVDRQLLLKLMSEHQPQEYRWAKAACTSIVSAISSAVLGLSTSCSATFSSAAAANAWVTNLPATRCMSIAGGGRVLFIVSCCVVKAQHSGRQRYRR